MMEMVLLNDGERVEVPGLRVDATVHPSSDEEFAAVSAQLWALAAGPVEFRESGSTVWVQFSLGDDVAVSVFLPWRSSHPAPNVESEAVKRAKALVLPQQVEAV